MNEETRLSLPLLDIVKRASRAPASGEVAAIRKRMNGASGARVILCDTSGSMADHVGSTGMRKIDHLQVALEDTLKLDPGIILIAFDSRAKRIPSAAKLPAPNGGTALHLALDMAADLKPSRTIVISDGCPDSEEYALEVARTMTGVINTIYCGPDGHPAIAFLRLLSEQTGGKHFTWDGVKTELASGVRALLTA